MKTSPIVGAPGLLYSIWDEVKVRHKTSALGLSGGGRNESNYTDTWNEMKWKGYTHPIIDSQKLQVSGKETRTPRN